MGIGESLANREYSLEPAELAFFKSQTRIDDDEELKKHILKVREEALAVSIYIYLPT